MITQDGILKKDDDREITYDLAGRMSIKQALLKEYIGDSFPKHYQSMQVTQFDSKDSYYGYHKTSRFTIGEESDAIDQYAETTDFIYTDDSTYANLQDGMVIMVEEGAGDYSVAEGPIIN